MNINMQDLVSVIIPTYNREMTIERAIRSVLNQTYANVEVIVVDDGSNDCTIDRIKKIEDTRVKLICGGHNGANHARNAGIEVARGVYIAFQDSDDEWYKHKLTTQIAYMQRYSFAACYCPYILCDNEDERIVPANHQDQEKYESGLVNTLKNGNVIGTPTLILKKDLIRDLGEKVFDELMPGLQDYDLAIRLAKITKVGYIKEPLMKAYRVDKSISKNGRFLSKAWYILIKKYYDFLNTDMMLKALKENMIESDNLAYILEEIDLIQSSVEKAGDMTRDIKTEVIGCLYEELKKRELLFREQNHLSISVLKTNNFVIYGLGKAARLVYRQIVQYGLLPDAFLVTEKNNECAQKLDGIPVFSAKMYGDKNVIVIICVFSLDVQLEIMEYIKSLGYSRIYICNQI